MINDRVGSPVVEDERTNCGLIDLVGGGINRFQAEPVLDVAGG